jgi:hypothetical protein
MTKADTNRTTPGPTIEFSGEPAVEVPVNRSRGKMNTKPILFWPRPRSDIERHLDREADDFLVVDTNCAYELQNLYKLRRETLIFDPFPHYGEHYRDFIDHVVASNCRYHIVGLEACQEVLRALRDPSLAHSSIEELLAAIKLACSGYNAPRSSTGVEADGSPFVLFSSPPIIKLKISIDWSYLNWANMSLSAILVFVATLIGSFLSFNNKLIAATVATFLFATLYVCVRGNFSELYSPMAGQPKGAAKNQLMATHGLMGSWFKK